MCFNYDSPKQIYIFHVYYKTDYNSSKFIIVDVRQPKNMRKKSERTNINLDVSAKCQATAKKMRIWNLPSAGCPKKRKIIWLL